VRGSAYPQKLIGRLGTHRASLPHYALDRGGDHNLAFEGAARILAKGKSSPKSQVKTVGLLETSLRFQCPERNQKFCALQPIPSRVIVAD